MVTSLMMVPGAQGFLPPPFCLFCNSTISLARSPLSDKTARSTGFSNPTARPRTSSHKCPILISLRNSHPQVPPNHILTKKVVGAGSNHQVTPPSGTRRGDSLRLRLLRPRHACHVAKLMTLTAKEAKGYSRRDYIHPFSLEVLRWLS
jgi:hypothetical protein